MTIHLSENIRNCRKDRLLTQEQLAEVLGVTVGAVHKWEAGLSVPELRLIVEMADFFDVSVDALLGYEVKDNSETAVLERFSDYLITLDPEGLAEAEKALKKYPNSFRIVYKSGLLYLDYSLGNHDRRQLNRSLELFRKSLLLLPQNTDPTISEHIIYGAMAEAYMLLDEWGKAVELWKQHNIGGLFNGQIGITIALNQKRPEEAEPYLSESFLTGLVTMLDAAAGIALYHISRGDHGSVKGISNWATDLVNALTTGPEVGFADKIKVIMEGIRAYALFREGDAGAARASLREAAGLAERFDAAPDYGLKTIRFVPSAQQAVAHDTLGETARESMEAVLRRLDDTALWKEVTEDERIG